MNHEQEISNSNELLNVSQSFDSKQYVRDILSATKNGEIDALKAYTVVKRLEKIAKDVLEDKEFKKLGLEAARKYMAGNSRTIELYSAKISEAVTYTYFDFSECGHPQLDELYKIQEQVKAAIKVIEDELKSLIPKETTQIGLGIMNDSKDIVIKGMPQLTIAEHEDQITVKAPKKIQQIGLKFMKI